MTMGADHPEALHELFAAAINAKDVEALKALYEPGAVCVDLAGNPVRDDGPLNDMLNGLVGAIDRIDGTTRKVFVAEDVALLSVNWTATMATPDGTQLANGTSGEIARRQPDGSWRFVIDDPMFT
jgi:ketosteroid isomerase-like protein